MKSGRGMRRHAEDHEEGQRFVKRVRGLLGWAKYCIVEENCEERQRNEKTSRGMRKEKEE